MAMVKYTREEVEKLKSLTDEARLDSMTDEDLRAAAESDPDNPPLTTEELQRMRPLKEVLPWLTTGGKRGRPAKEKPKVSITIRLNPDILEYFKEGGEGWQTRLESALQTYILDHKQAA